MVRNLHIIDIPPMTVEKLQDLYDKLSGGSQLPRGSVDHFIRKQIDHMFDDGSQSRYVYWCWTEDDNKANCEKVTYSTFMYGVDLETIYNQF